MNNPPVDAEPPTSSGGFARRSRRPRAENTPDPIDEVEPVREQGTASDRTGRWVFATGTLALVAIAFAAFVVLSPLTNAHRDLHRAVNDGMPVERSLGYLRTDAFNFQIFIESNLDDLVPGATPLPTVLARGVQIVETQTAQEVALAASLRRMGLGANADSLDTAMAMFTVATSRLTPIAAGHVVSSAVRVQIVAEERAALVNLWTVAASLDRYLSTDIVGADSSSALRHLDTGRALFLLATLFNLLLALSATTLFGGRAVRRERARLRETRRRAHEVRLQRALDMTANEASVYDILGESLHDSTPGLKVEMLIADSSRAHFRRAFTSAGDFEGCGVVSPAECPAATGGQPLFFPSSSALDACPQLKGRNSGACSAACFPVSIAGRTVAVMHAVGPDEILPSPIEVASLQFTSRRGTDRISMLRAFTASESQARTDPVTGLLNRRALEHRVRDLGTEAVPYTLAYGGIDHFAELEETHGHEMGDQVLRLFARVLGDSVRPNDIVARNVDETFLVVLPDCSTEVAVGVLERMRERLALALTAGKVPAFTVTFGVASTADAAGFEDVVAIAARALVDAQEAGRNRVVVATGTGTSAGPAPTTVGPSPASGPD